MNINEAMILFATEMLAKFEATEHKHPGQSIIKDGIDSITLEEISAHFIDEVMELHDAETPEQEQGESVDVANMAFLTWWKHQEIKDFLDTKIILVK